MTHVEQSPVRREARTARGDAVVVFLRPEGIYLREKGRRTAFLMPYGVAYQYAAKLAVEAERRERKARKRTRGAS